MEKSIWVEALNNEQLEWFIRTSLKNLHSYEHKDFLLGNIIACATELKKRVKEHKA